MWGLLVDTNLDVFLPKLVKLLVWMVEYQDITSAFDWENYPYHNPVEIDE